MRFKLSKIRKNCLWKSSECLTWDAVYKTLSGILVASLIVSCGNPKSKNDAVVESSSSAIHPELIGTWVLDCILPSIDNPSSNSDFRYKLELGITKDQITYVQMAHLDDTCQKPAFSIKTVDSYVPRGKLGSSEIVYKWDWKRVSNDRTILEPTLVTSNNSSKNFGYSDWALNVPKSILGKSPSPTDKPYSKAGDLFFGIYKIENQAGYFKTLDAVNDGLTKATRINGLDSNVKFKKKASSK